MNFKTISAMLFSFAFLLSAAETAGKNINKEPVYFKHNVTTKQKPWTHTDFGDRGMGKDFSFAIVADRAGRPRAGVFESAINKLNKMRPDFVLSVGDFINGCNMERQDEAFIRKQWSEVLAITRKSVPPFFHVVGNHDVSAPTKMFPGLHERTTAIWNSYFGPTYYYFIYKDTLFICMNNMEGNWDGGSNPQIDWAIDVLKKNQNVRWTFVFMHCPKAWKMKSFEPLEKALYDRNYTVISGDFHKYTKYVRNGRKYFVLGTTGGGGDDLGKIGAPPRGVALGEFDHVTWVSMCGDKPEFMNLALEGLYDEDVVTTEKITWLTANYYRANKPLSKEEAARLRAKGIYIEEEKE